MHEARTVTTPLTAEGRHEAAAPGTSQVETAGDRPLQPSPGPRGSKRRRSSSPPPATVASSVGPTRSTAQLGHATSASDGDFACRAALFEALGLEPAPALRAGVPLQPVDSYTRDSHPAVAQGSVTFAPPPIHIVTRAPVPRPDPPTALAQQAFPLLSAFGPCVSPAPEAHWAARQADLPGAASDPGRLPYQLPMHGAFASRGGMPPDAQTLEASLEDLRGRLQQAIDGSAWSMQREVEQLTDDAACNDVPLSRAAHHFHTALQLMGNEWQRALRAMHDRLAALQRRSATFVRQEETIRHLLDINNRLLRDISALRRAAMPPPPSRGRSADI